MRRQSLEFRAAGSSWNLWDEVLEGTEQGKRVVPEICMRALDQELYYTYKEQDSEWSSRQWCLQD